MLPRRKKTVSGPFSREFSFAASALLSVVCHEEQQLERVVGQLAIKLFARGMIGFSFS